VKKNLKCVIFGSLIWGSIMTLAIIQPQEPILYDNNLSHELVIINPRTYSYVVLNKEQKDEEQRNDWVGQEHLNQYFNR